MIHYLKHFLTLSTYCVYIIIINISLIDEYLVHQPFNFYVHKQYKCLIETPN